MYKQNLFKHLLSILAVVSITSFAGVGASYAEGDEVGENSGTGSTETPTGSDPVGAVTGIKIATKSFNDARFSYVRRDLDETIATIRDVVSNAITNTTNIAALQDGKQTRPDDNHACETGKTCLLVTDTSGIRNWYEIIDCNEHAFFSNMGNGIGPGASGGKYCDNGYNTAASGYRDCTSSEWGHLYENGMVYGVARAVAIAEAPGTVVTLPGNVAVGDTCVCRVTGYAPLVSGTFAGRNAVYASTPASFTTDKWVVGGKISTYYTSAPGTAMTDANCIDVCGFGTGDDGALKSMYFASISNTCMASASEAQMCRYYPFFATVAANGVTNNGVSSRFIGSVSGDGVAWGACSTDGVYYSNSHCATTSSNRQTWIAGYYDSESRNAIGYIYGDAGYATLPSGTQENSMVDLNLSDVSSTNNGQNARVCVVRGYKAAADATETNVVFNKAFVVRFNENGFNDSDNAAVACAEIVARGDTSLDSSNVFAWYSALADICVAY